MLKTHIVVWIHGWKWTCCIHSSPPQSYANSLHVETGFSILDAESFEGVTGGLNRGVREKGGGFNESHLVLNCASHTCDVRFIMFGPHIIISHPLFLMIVCDSQILLWNSLHGAGCDCGCVETVCVYCW